MGSFSKKIDKLTEQMDELKSHLEETELSLFQAVVKLEALSKLIIEKELINYDELEDYMKQVLEYYQEQASTEVQDTDTNDSNNSGKLNIEVIKDPEYSIHIE